ncbi:MAG TPA: hypothetical protein VNS08_12365 [Ureibacillus sp.]|nr:hypothetical protein [Ureibacillus sp.]
MTWFTLWMVVINTSFWLILCFGFAFLVRYFPKSFYEKNQWFFKEYRFEKKIYKRIQVDKWKDKLPEWGSVFKFEKKNLNQNLSISYINTFILETKYAEIGHLGMAILGFACILVNPSDYAMMAIICSTINFIIQIPFCLIQRYNRPRLNRIKLRLENKETK